MVTARSSGITETERLLTEFCERSLLKLWSYPNHYKDDAHELCDLLAVFENHVFIFFDRENELADSPDKNPQVLWDRWTRKVIDRQVRTAHGAERYSRALIPAMNAAIVTGLSFAGRACRARPRSACRR